MFLLKYLRFCVFDANSGADGGGQNAGSNAGAGTNNQSSTNQGANTDPGANANANDGGGTGKPSDTKSFTQDEVDKIISERLKRAETQWQKTIDAKLDEERKRAAMTEAERLKAEKDEADKRAKQAVDVANTRIINAEARAVAAAAGVKAEKIAHVVRLADLSAVTVGDDGSPDVNAIKTSIDAVLKDVPEFKGTSTAANADAGSKNQPGTLTIDEFANMSLDEIRKRKSEVEALFAKTGVK